MADTFGAVPIPLQSPPQATPTSDPGIGFLLDYLKAWLVDDGNVTAAWQIPFINPAQAAVVKTYAFDPRKEFFDTSKLPALYGWRESGKSEWIADDIELEDVALKLLWIFPLGTPENQQFREPFANGLVKAINLAIERGRTPSWTQPNDPDVYAPIWGSFIGNYFGIWSLRDPTWRATTVADIGRDGRVKYVYPSIEITYAMQENLALDITRYDPVPVAGIQVTVTDGQSGHVTEGPVNLTPASTAPLWAQNFPKGPPADPYN